MSQDLIVSTITEGSPAVAPLPALIARRGHRTALRYLEFFAASIGNANTRHAYWRACSEFFRFMECRHALGDIADIEPLHVGAWVEGLRARYAAATVKLRLAAVRRCFDWLIVGGHLQINPASPVRGPSLVAATGKTPVLMSPEARLLIDSIETDAQLGLRDRALICVLIFTFARISAALAMNRRDYFQHRGRAWLRLHEKGGKRHEMPAHQGLVDALEAYIGAGGFGDLDAPLFQSAVRRRDGWRLSGKRLVRRNALHMIKRRAAAAGLPATTCAHTFRATGITAYLEQDGAALEHAQQMANHASPRTTKLYDRTRDEVLMREVDRIAI